jgi:hypothetical protein
MVNNKERLKQSKRTELKKSKEEYNKSNDLYKGLKTLSYINKCE